jgi:hypothetical protein
MLLPANKSGSMMQVSLAAPVSTSQSAQPREKTTLGAPDRRRQGAAAAADALCAGLHFNYRLINSLESNAIATVASVSRPMRGCAQSTLSASEPPGH